MDHVINGVLGRLESSGKYQQKWISRGRKITKTRVMNVFVRFDDACKNGHATFSITAQIYVPGKPDIESCGCLHDDIARYFPELAPLIKWHLCGADGPMYYIANTLYHADDRDHWGLRKGETRQIKNEKTGIPCWELVAKTPVEKYVDSATKPNAPASFEYVPWNRVGEGKPRELDHARSCAIWPEATDAQLCAPCAELEAALHARLPALMAEFRAVIAGIGFTWYDSERGEK